MTAIITVFGLVIGSFINALIYRLPRGLGMDGRSVCTSCSTTIEWYDLIPVLSFLFLRGRCRKCSKRISATYPLVELLTGALFFLFAKQFVTSVTDFNGYIRLAYGLFVLSSFVAIAFIDLKYYIIPDRINYAILAVGAVFLATLKNLDTLWTALIGLFLLGTLFLIIYLISNGKWMGFGDVKLAAVMGFVFGIAKGLIVVYFAILAGAVFGIILIIRKKANMKSKVPFGTFLAGSSIFFMIYEGVFDKILSLFI